jgi:hypothetical protein
VALISHLYWLDRSSDRHGARRRRHLLKLSLCRRLNPNPGRDRNHRLTPALFVHSALYRNPDRLGRSLLPHPIPARLRKCGSRNGRQKITPGALKTPPSPKKEQKVATKGIIRIDKTDRFIGSRRKRVRTLKSLRQALAIVLPELLYQPQNIRPVRTMSGRNWSFVPGLHLLKRFKQRH